MEKSAFFLRNCFFLQKGVFCVFSPFEPTMRTEYGPKNKKLALCVLKADDRSNKRSAVCISLILPLGTAQ